MRHAERVMRNAPPALTRHRRAAAATHRNPSRPAPPDPLVLRRHPPGYGAHAASAPSLTGALPMRRCRRESVPLAGPQAIPIPQRASHPEAFGVTSRRRRHLRITENCHLRAKPVRGPPPPLSTADRSACNPAPCACSSKFNLSLAWCGPRQLAAGLQG